MKLLNKREIDVAKSNDRKRELDEGLKIARRVDSLREIRAAEEVSLEEFRKKTVARIQEEIKLESIALDTLRSEVVLLQDKRKKALEPIEQEQLKLAYDRLLIQEENQKLAHERVNFRLLEAKIKAESETVHKELEIAARERKIASTLLKSADQKSLEAIATFTQAQDTLSKAQTFQKETNEQLSQRELSVSNREKSQKLRDEAQDKREKELNALETKLRDRAQLIERNGKRRKGRE